MSNDTSRASDFQQKFMQLVSGQQSFSDLHLEQGAAAMVKTPRGWQQFHEGPLTLGELRPLLDSIDEDWEDKIVEKALDRPFVLQNCRLRCNIYRLGAGAKVALSVRRLPLEPLLLERTGLPSYVRTMLESNKGLILVTGPTGSGKTTTIASMLDYINTNRNGHIVTIEEPIEYTLQRKQSIISQKEVPIDTASFSSGLREALRQKPDVLMVGEIRDYDTAETVLHAGESGHLVLATMHTGNAVGAISKLLSFFPVNQRAQRSAMLASSLIGVIFQSLLPSENGENYVLASEMVFNHNQQIAPYIVDPDKLHMISDYMKRKEDSMSRPLNEVLQQLVARKEISARDALRVAYNRLELREMLGNTR